MKRLFKYFCVIFIRERIFYLLNLLFILFLSCEKQSKNIEFKLEAIELNNKALSYYKNGKIDSAVCFYDKAIDLDSNYYIPHLNKITIYLLKKEYKKAIFEGERAINKKPDLAEVWTLVGMIYDFLGDSIKAKSYYLKSIEIFNHRISNPKKIKNLEANRINRAISLILLGKDKEGKQELRKVKKENPDNRMVDEYLKLSKQEYIKQIIVNK